MATHVCITVPVGDVTSPGKSNETHTEQWLQLHLFPQEAVANHFHREGLQN